MTKQSNYLTWKNMPKPQKKQNIDNINLITLPDDLKIPDFYEFTNEELQGVVHFIAEFETISTVRIMRHFKYGYCKAAGIVDLLESLEYISFLNKVTLYKVLI